MQRPAAIDIRRLASVPNEYADNSAFTLFSKVNSVDELHYSNDAIRASIRASEQ